MANRHRKFLLSLISLQITCLFLISLWIFSESFKVIFGVLPFFVPSIILIVTGIILLFFQKKVKASKKLRRHLKMIGFSSALFFPFVAAHNFLDFGAGIVGGFLGGVLGFLSALFFITALIICPVILVVGVLGSLFKLLK